MAYSVEIDSFGKEYWQKNAGSFSDYSIYQTWDYQENRCRMSGQQISRAIVKDEKGQVRLMCQVRIKSIPVVGLKIGYIQWGPLVSSKKEDLCCSADAFKSITDSYFNKGINVLRVVPNIRDNGGSEDVTKALSSSGFELSGNIFPYRTLVVDTGLDEDKLRSGLRKSFRRDLRKAEQSGIEIRQGHSSEFGVILEKLYKESLRRKGFRGIPIEEFIRPQKTLADDEKMTFTAAFVGNDPVSIHLASNLGDTGVVLLAASNEQGLSCGASYLVWYQGAVAAIKKGLRYYDLGGIDPDNNRSVYLFKSRMGGSEVKNIGAYEIYSSSVVKSMWTLAEKSLRLIRR